MAFFLVHRKHKFDLYLPRNGGQWSSLCYLALSLVVMFESIPYMQVLICKQVFPRILNSTKFGRLPNISESCKWSYFLPLSVYGFSKAWHFSRFGKIWSVGIWRPIKTRCKITTQILPTEIYDCRNKKVGHFHGNNCLNARSKERANSAAETWKQMKERRGPGMASIGVS